MENKIEYFNRSHLYVCLQFWIALPILYEFLMHFSISLYDFPFLHFTLILLRMLHLLKSLYHYYSIYLIYQFIINENNFKKKGLIHPHIGSGSTSGYRSFLQGTDLVDRPLMYGPLGRTSILVRAMWISPRSCQTLTNSFPFQTFRLQVYGVN